MKKRLRGVWYGLGAGLCLLLLLLVPFGWRSYDASRRSAISQHNLVNAAGEGQQVPQSHHVLVQAKPGDTAAESLSVSLSGQRWHDLGAGSVVLAYDPQVHHQVSVAFRNRKASMALSARAMAEQKLEADISLAPDADPLVFFEGAAADGEKRLRVQNAQSCRVLPETPGITARLEEDRLALSFDAELLKANFFCFRLLFQNAHGEALTTVAVLPRQEEEYTPIYTAEELQAVRRNPGGYYRLMNDISLEGRAWQPLGSEKTLFTGVFDGGGHAVRGLAFAPADGEERGNFSLLGYCEHAVVRNLCIINPQIDGRYAGSDQFSAAALATAAAQCLIENCAVFGGRIVTDKGSAAGLVVSAQESVLTHLFNSADIEVVLPGSVMQNTGGITANMDGYMSYCANEGAVAATHLTGGLFGFGPQVSVWRCINTGRVTGAVFIGEYPPGAFCQTIGAYFLSDCIFTRGSAGRAGSVFEAGMFSSIRVIEPEDVQNKAALAVLGALEGEDAQWLLGDPDAAGPLPGGIRTLKGYRPGGDE